MGPCMCGDTQCPSCGSAQGTLNLTWYVNDADVDSIIAFADEYHEVYVSEITRRGSGKTKISFDCDNDLAYSILEQFGYSAVEDDGERWCENCNDSYNIAAGCVCGRK
jgi:hypothetical protein